MRWWPGPWPSLRIQNPGQDFEGGILSRWGPCEREFRAAVFWKSRIAPSLGNRKTETGLSWTSVLLTDFPQNCDFFLVFLAEIFIWLVFVSSHLLSSQAENTFFFLFLRQLFSINPCLFSLSCSVILSFLFHSPLSTFLLSIWAAWFTLFLEWRQREVSEIQRSWPAPGIRKAWQRTKSTYWSFQHFYYGSDWLFAQLETPWLAMRTINVPGFYKGNLVTHWVGPLIWVLLCVSISEGHGRKHLVHSDWET